MPRFPFVSHQRKLEAKMHLFFSNTFAENCHKYNVGFLLFEKIIKINYVGRTWTRNGTRSAIRPSLLFHWANESNQRLFHNLSMSKWVKIPSFSGGYHQWKKINFVPFFSWLTTIGCKRSSHLRQKNHFISWSYHWKNARSSNNFRWHSFERCYLICWNFVATWTAGQVRKILKIQENHKILCFTRYLCSVKLYIFVAL